jgi:hypothetical protein
MEVAMPPAEGLARRRGFRSGFCRRLLTRPNRMTVSPGPGRRRDARSVADTLLIAESTRFLSTPFG